MKNHIFIYFTIKGDNLDLDNIQKLIPLNAEIFEKGKKYSRKIGGLLSPQKTNRWVYSREFANSNNLNACLNEIIKELKPFFKKIKLFTKKYNSIFEIVIYVNKKTSIFNTKLSKKSVKNLCELNTKIDITFIDF